MTTMTTEQAFTACEANKTAWLERRAELAQAEQELRSQVLNPDEQIPARMKWLREVIAVRRWEVNQAAGRYIRSHEEVQRLSIQHRLNDFMQVHGTEPMNLNDQSALIKTAPWNVPQHICAMRWPLGWKTAQKLIMPYRIMTF